MVPVVHPIPRRQDAGGVSRPEGRSIARFVVLADVEILMFVICNALVVRKRPVLKVCCPGLNGKTLTVDKTLLICCRYHC